MKTYDLFGKVIANSTSSEFDVARHEWCVSGCIDLGDNSDEWERCVCGKDGIRYCYTITNTQTGTNMFPIGSECIKKFGSESMLHEMKRETQLMLFKNELRKVVGGRLNGVNYRISPEWLRDIFVINALTKVKAISVSEYSFLYNIHRKRKLTSRQYVWVWRICGKVSEFFTIKIKNKGE